MKQNFTKSIILLILSMILSVSSFATTSFSSSTSHSEYSRLCKIFKHKALKYEKTMRSDSYARQTLESYQKRAKIFCSK